MNDSLYEDYMRSVLGYQPMNNYDNYSNYEVVPTMAQTMSTRPMTAMSNIQMQELEKCYPAIYRIVYPMIQKACAENRGEVTKELIDRMTDEIYSAVEDRELVENRNKVEADKRKNR